MENIFVEFLPPWVEANMQPAFYDKESGTVLQQTARMYDRVNMLVRMFNKLSKETKTVVEDYIEQFNELHDYVHDYFDNLDVQEEINNKIDAMVESGDFAEALEPYLSEYLGELRSFEKLMNWHNVTSEKHTDDVTGTEYYITEIPYDNQYTGKNIMRVGLANDDDTCTTLEKPSSFAIRHESPVVINAGMMDLRDENRAYGIVIKDGVLLNNYYFPTDQHTYYRDLLCIKEDGSMKFVRDLDINPQTLINEGYVDVILGWYGLLQDGEYVDYSGFSETGALPRQVICRKENGDYLILTCDGRTEEDPGLSIDDVLRILNDYNVNFIFVLDGGGSTDTIFKGTKINKDIDNYGLSERAVATMLYVDSKGSEIYFLNGKSNLENHNNKIETDIKLRQAPNAETYFTGNLYNKDDPNILTNKSIDNTTGEVIDYDNTSGQAKNDVMLTDYIQVPADRDIYAVNSRDWNVFWFFDENKNYLYAHSYNVGGAYLTVHTAEAVAYVRTTCRRDVMPTFGLYVGNVYDGDRYEAFPKNYYKYDVLFDSGDSTGSQDVTLGDISKYKKLKIFAIDSSSQQDYKEVLVTSDASIYTYFARVNVAGTTQGSFLSSRIAINKTTGVVTFDREYNTTFGTTPSITITDASPRLKITRVEGYIA